MPIYGYGLLGAPYTVDNNVTKQDLLKFEQIFNKILYNNYHFLVIRVSLHKGLLEQLI